MAKLTYECGVTWEWEPRSETWLFGKPNNGIGIYKENGLWYGNLIKPNGGIMFGPWATAEEGMIQVYAEYREME